MTRSLWILNHYAAGPGAATGTRHYDLGRKLSHRGWEVTIFASSFDHQIHRETRLQHGQWMKEETHEGVQFIWVRTLPYRHNDWRRVLNMISYVFNVLRAGWRRYPAEVIIGSSVHPFAAWAGYVLARHHRARFFFEVRDLWPQTLIDLGEVPRGHLFIRVLAWLERLLYTRAERIITLLPNAHEYIESLGIPPEKITYIPNGVDLERYEKPLPELPPELDVVLARMNGCFIVIYAGAHGVANHLDTVLDAAKQLQERGNGSVRFLFVGDGPDKPRLQHRASNEGIRNVTFLSPIDKTYIPSLLSRCNAGVLCLAPSPLYRYGISLNKMFDYMAASLPVIMTGDARSNPVIESGGGVVLRGDDVVGLARILEVWAANPKLAREIGRQGRAFVERKHSTSALASSLLSSLANFNNH